MAKAVFASEANLAGDFFDDRTPFGKIAIGPLPFFMKAQAAIGQDFRSCFASPGAYSPV